jgi:hypothetical protein
VKIRRENLIKVRKILAIQGKELKTSRKRPWILKGKLILKFNME